MKNRILLAVLALSLGGCAGVSARLAERQNPNVRWVGASEADLIREWGVPDGQVDLEGARILEYKRRQRVSYSEDGRDGRIHYDSFTFEVRDGKVTDTKHLKR